MRYVCLKRPFIVRKGCHDWQACQKWSLSHLKTVMKDHPVNVAITPHGNADSVLEIPDDGLIFVIPFEHQERFEDVVDAISKQELHKLSSEAVRYAQTQNDNLRNEYEAIFSDVPKSIDFARIALQKQPDAVNFWLGNSYSTTALHKDNYENVYVQVLGWKHFTLLPPVAAPCINEQILPAATYNPSPSLQKEHLKPQLDDPAATIPFATWDPDVPNVRATPFSHLVTPMRFTLNPGDMLYLPAMWYHKVQQSCSEEGICVAVNYWYDMEYGGNFWSGTGFVRDVGLALAKEVEDEQ